MSTIPRYILISQARFADGPFSEWVGRMERSRVGVGRLFSQALTFWLNACQDVLRLNELRIRDKRLREAARVQRLELAGREGLLLAELSGGQALSLEQLFSREHEPMRYAIYELVAEALRAAGDHQRILLLLVLKSASGLLCEQVVRLMGLRAPGSRDQLRLPEGHLGAYLTLLELSDQEYDDTVDIIDGAYNAVRALLEALGQQLEHDLTRQEIRERGS